MKKEIFELDFFGKKLLVEFNDLTSQTSGSVTVSIGNTKVLVTVVISEEVRGGVDFLPLSVEFEEKSYAVGRIIGSQFQKREGRPTDQAVLSGRIIDRTIRPLFDKWIRNDIQVVATVISLGDYDSDFLGVLGASLAISVSKIPFSGPISAIRVIKNKDGQTVFNPSYAERESCLLELLVCGNSNSLNMIEMWSKESNEEETFDLMAKTSEFLTVLDDFQKKIIKKIGVEKILIPKPEFSSSMISLFNENIKNNLEDILFTKENDFKSSGKESLKKLKDLWASLCQTAVKNGNLKDDEVSLKDQFLEEKIDEFVHDMAINKKKRFDGRGVDDIRPLFAQAGKVSESLHGSGIFYRGGTHILSVLTLGGREDAQVVDGMEVSEKKRFMLHYNFPPYSVGEVGRFGGLNRRMIGHGALAEKALSSVIPSEDVFPYTIRIVAESMASNGSTSMASVCASTLALMDGGVPIEKPVAGISIGLMENKDNFVVLTDIAGPEDHHGDMDFKVAGTRDGITAIQMDIKVSGIRLSVLKEALDRAKIARIKILDVIESEISKPRENLSSYAPVIDKIQIKTDQIGLVIGPSGKTVNAIRKKTDTNITIEDDGLVYVTGPKAGVAEAISTIESMTKRYEVGDKLTVTITKIVDFGAFAQMSPNAEGLIHISEINDGFSESVDKFLKVGQTVPVIIKDIDERGRYKLSIKSADPNFFKNK